MDELRERLQPVIDQLPESLREWWWLIGAVVVGAALLIAWAVLERVVIRPLFGRRPRPMPNEDYLRVDLARLPVPPTTVGHSLRIEGVPVRIRMVVLAPLGQGRRHALPDDSLSLLDRVLPGLSAVVRADGATVKLWPAQVSRAGFAPKFHSLVTAPGSPGDASPWVLAAGPVRSGDRQFSLGLALEADQPCYLGRVTVTPDRWTWLLRVQPEAAAG